MEFPCFDCPPFVARYFFRLDQRSISAAGLAFSARSLRTELRLSWFMIFSCQKGFQAFPGAVQPPFDSTGGHLEGLDHFGLAQFKKVALDDDRALFREQLPECSPHFPT